MSVLKRYDAGFDTNDSPGVRDSLFITPDSLILQVGSPTDSLNLEKRLNENIALSNIDLVWDVFRIVSPFIKPIL